MSDEKSPGILLKRAILDAVPIAFPNKPTTLAVRTVRPYRQCDIPWKGERPGDSASFRRETVIFMGD
ncbi:hypothetical protein [Pseudooceanicola sp. HF7]|uniref:hypothetical protein n=1 Tax=Pseudooceanicola sp. HF7 TaxID=2721560 RepID=UPI00142FDA00|nr:hypothetical protein [Pseudooceanicola sp. HF7]